MGSNEHTDGKDSERTAAFLEMDPNAPIGLWPGLEFVGEHIENIKNRPLLLYTDGLNEAENKEQEQFGDDHVLSFLRDGTFANAKEVVEQLKIAVAQHRNGAAPNDDLTLLCLKVG